MEEIFQTDQLIKYIYIHIPFCLKKCNYCSFYSEIYSEDLKKNFVSCLIEEIKLFKDKFDIKPETIYFGGGTPSLLFSDDLNTIISNLVPIQQLPDGNIEITLEANPININKIQGKELAETLINRISLGVQSFLDKELKLLGRLHNAEQIYKAYENLRSAGFKNISFDLIYGLPNQTIKDVTFSLERIIDLDPEHISTYCLSLGKDVPLYNMKKQIPSDEEVSKFYYFIRDKLMTAGYEHYEISNFAKEGFESRHNLCYWNDEFYLGLGRAASGYIERNRYTNPSDLYEYFIQIETMEVFGNFRSLSKSDHEKEFIFLSLRKTAGMNLKEFQKKFQTDFLKKY
ncbi:MAG: radical SAM family heme chaperone HemW, partial [Candidatus Cloacimonetes bacterium]|nr:radical SAM family heme chaperone HemW [Candidatus Cloacimonadota bacterium]